MWHVGPLTVAPIFRAGTRYLWGRIVGECERKHTRISRVSRIICVVQNLPALPPIPMEVGDNSKKEKDRLRKIDIKTKGIVSSRVHLLSAVSAVGLGVTWWPLPAHCPSCWFINNYGFCGILTSLSTKLWLSWCGVFSTRQPPGVVTNHFWHCLTAGTVAVVVIGSALDTHGVIRDSGLSAWKNPGSPNQDTCVDPFGSTVYVVRGAVGMANSRWWWGTLNGVWRPSSVYKADYMHELQPPALHA